jgi:hypothetical protein
MGNEGLDLYFNGQDVVVAYNEEDAAQVWDEAIQLEQDHLLYPWTKMDRSIMFCLIVTEDGELPSYLPDNAKIKVNDAYHYLISASCGAWAKSQGRGLLSMDEL